MAMQLVCDCDEKPPPYSRYYDSPDGCDVETKALVLGRYGLIAGAVLSHFDILMYSHPVGIVNIMKRVLYHTAPLTLMGVTFAVVTNSVLQMRNVDDKLNYFIGGVATSPIATAYVGYPVAIVPIAVTLGATAVIKKMAIDADMCLNPKAFPHKGMINSWRNDWTLAKDPKDELDNKCKALIDKYRAEIRKKNKKKSDTKDEDDDECED